MVWKAFTMAVFNSNERRISPAFMSSFSITTVFLDGIAGPVGSCGFTVKAASVTPPRWPLCVALRRTAVRSRTFSKGSTSVAV